MITAVHALLYSREAVAARAFFQKVLKWKSVDAGNGWLIFAMPPVELAVHPVEGAHGPELYLMCDGVERTVAELERNGAKMLTPISDQGWGRVTTIRIPGGVELGLYEPRHKLAVRLRGQRRRRPASGSKKRSKKRARSVKKR